MSRKISILAVVLCVALFGVGSTLALEGGRSVEISSPAESPEDSGTVIPADGEMEEVEEPILTVLTDLWETMASSAAVVGLLFGPGSGTTAA
jgi:hypothetical protein